jgi:4-hydroxy-L-threonine phosphate dehydrogenase PdxA
MESKIKRMYHQDNVIVICMLVALWAVLIFTITQVVRISPDHATGIMIAAIGIVTGSFATASCIAVLVHLKKNKNKLYSEEINGVN